MNTNANGKKGLTIRDLVTIGIFSALFLVFALVGGIFFAPNPVLTFYMPVGSALLCGPVYLLMLARVKKRGAASLLGALMCLVWFVTGMHWAMALGYLVMAWPPISPPARGNMKTENSTPFPMCCCLWGERARIWCSSPIRRAGRKPCWETAPSNPISTPCAPPERAGFCSPCWRVR